MSPHKLRKTRKRRGSRTMGWGQVGQHRKHGEKGGRNVGKHKHLWSYVLRYEPNYFGKTGFKTPQTITGQSHPNTINIDQLDQLIDKQTRHKQITKKQGKPYIDLTALGYGKLLSKGKLTKPALIKINAYSEAAAKKIQEAGGKIIETTKEPEKPETHEATEAHEPAAHEAADTEPPKD
ncbi:MAG TPA: uL15 family ribosomal protein [Candidatus Bathyarchaeia archaeon]|nr:uL15 family ribosomal protein [Candidatus Bathyarchaeia archaeon]